MANFQLNKTQTLKRRPRVVFIGRLEGISCSLGKGAEIYPKSVSLSIWTLEKQPMERYFENTWAWPKYQGDAAPSMPMDENMKCALEVFRPSLNL